MKKVIFKNQQTLQKEQTLSNNKVNKIEKSFSHEFTKATDNYLSVELEKYKKLTIIVEVKK